LFAVVQLSLGGGGDGGSSTDTMIRGVIMADTTTAATAIVTSITATAAGGGGCLHRSSNANRHGLGLRRLRLHVFFAFCFFLGYI